MRPRSTSARASGRAMSARMAPAATSSSAKNALPSERARIRSTTAGGTGRPQTAWRCLASSARPKGDGSRSAPGRGGGPARPAAAAGGGGGAARRSGSWPPGRPGRRAGSGSGRPAGRVERSAQWRSSITSSGASSDRRTSSDSTSSNSWTCSKPSGGGAGPWSVASSGSSRPRLGTAAASGAVTSASSGCAEVAEGVDEGHIGGRRHRPPCSRLPGPDAAVGGPGGELVQQPGLADAGVAGDQFDGRPPAVGLGRAGRAGGRPRRPGRRSCWRSWRSRRKVQPSGGQRGTPALPLEDPAALHQRRGRRPAVPGRRAGRRAHRSRRPGGRGRGRRPGPASRAARRTTVADRTAAIGVIPWRTTCRAVAWRSSHAGRRRCRCHRRSARRP